MGTGYLPSAVIEDKENRYEQIWRSFPKSIRQNHSAHATGFHAAANDYSDCVKCSLHSGTASGKKHLTDGSGEQSNSAGAYPVDISRQ